MLGSCARRVQRSEKNYVVLPSSASAVHRQLPAEEKSKLELHFEDDQLLTAKSVSVFHKLKSTRDIDAVFVLGSGVGNALSPLAESSKTLMVAIGASDKSFAVGTKYVFIHWVIPETEAALMSTEIKNLGHKRIGIISNEQEGAIALEEALIGELEKQGLKDSIVISERVLTDTRDFRTIIAKLRAKKVDGIAVCLLPGGLSAFAKQTRDSGLKADFFGFELFEDESEVEASGGALVGKWYVNADDAGVEFQEMHKNTYGKRAGWAAANAFDTMKLVAEGINKLGKDNKKIAGYLRTLENYRGAAGVYSARGDNRFELPATVKIVTEDGFEKKPG